MAFAVAFFVPLMASTGIVFAADNTYDNTTFAWTDAQTITASGKVNDTFVKGSGESYARSTKTSGDCSDTLQPKAGNNAKATLVILKSGTRGTCVPKSQVTVVLTDTSKATLDAADNNDGTDEEGAAPDCLSSGNPLTFMLCPIIDGLAGSADFIYGHLVQPLLATKPLSLRPSDPMFQAWSQFRVLGDIFLIIALLVMVFGQTIGGGIIDAYTVKKVLPRLLLAAIGINLSYYFVAAAVDITNIVGDGIINLIEAPFKQSGTFVLSPSGTGATLGLAALTTGALILAFGSVGSWIWVFILIPMILTLLAILATVIIRRGLIILLVLLAPIAFALYCLPNTEQYFRKWWDLLFRTLLVYPIIAALFGIANVLSVTISYAGNESSTVVNALSSFVAMIALFIPLFLIPFSFRIAGGVIGKASEVFNAASKRGHEAFKGNPNDVTSRQNRAKKKVSDNITQRRVGMESATRGNKNKLIRGLGSAIGGGANLQERAAILNAQDAQRMQTNWGNGDDSSPKAATLFHSMKALKDTERYRLGDNGEGEYQAADGSWHSESMIKKGYKNFGGSHSMMQENFKQMMAKTEPLGSDAQEKVLQDYIGYANGEKLDDGTATGRWQGIAIPMKGMRLDQRRAKISRNKETGKLEHKYGDVDRKGLNTEFAGMGMHDIVKETPGTFEALKDSILFTANRNVTTNPVEIEAMGKIDDDSRAAAARAYKNLERYVSGGRSVPQGAREVSGEDGAGGYSSSDSAAYKNAEAAKQALDALNSAGVGDWVRNNYPDDLNRMLKPPEPTPPQTSGDGGESS